MAGIEPDGYDGARPPSDVSPWVGLVGLASLLLWIAIARNWAAIADAFSLTTPRMPLSGPYAAMAGLVFVTVPMVLWSVFVDKVHRRPSTGLDWSLGKTRRPDHETSLTKLAGLWATWAILACLYCLCRWYWNGNYLFALEVLAVMGAGMVVLSVPYVFWLDRYMLEPRDHSWHFGAMLFMRSDWDRGEVAKHWRAWLIKGFFGAFMISIVPGNFANVINADIGELASNPVVFGMVLINLLFLVDVLIGTVGYIVTLRPLDAHIRSGNPFLAGWLAALICYPPFVWGILGNGQVMNYEQHVGSWHQWLAGNTVLLWAWALWLVALTGFYAWATFAFGLRFSNLTYRGVLTTGPYRFTRHPAYLSKNLYWWFSVLPFLVVNGNPVDAIRNTFFLLCVNGIYYWRARTEEAHLLLEDPKYRAYHAYMGRKGLITAPLARLGDAFRRRFASPAG
ncbi:MAG: protein-S-isoprenylcysteine methyltransferase [Citromicrobium sp.]|nr:MAG: protein-S-isoprenylcysteine methyltransferase [Citromicrobium sp.]